MAGKNVSVKVEWNDKEFLQVALRNLQRNGERVGMYLSGKVVKSISTGQSIRRPKRRAKGLSSIGKRRRIVGLNPSSPGQPPRVLTGRLRNSINHSVKRTATGVIVYVGAYTPYARALELGNPKGNLEARPYLRPAIYTSRKKIVKLFGKDLFR